MNFWDQYSWWVLVALAVFPRLSLFLLFPWGGWLWWVGWFVTPHLLVAILALGYWETNPALVVMSWVIAVAGPAGFLRDQNQLPGHGPRMILTSE